MQTRENTEKTEEDSGTVLRNLLQKKDQFECCCCCCCYFLTSVVRVPQTFRCGMNQSCFCGAAEEQEKEGAVLRCLAVGPANCDNLMLTVCVCLPGPVEIVIRNFLLDRSLLNGSSRSPAWCVDILEDWLERGPLLRSPEQAPSPLEYRFRTL